MSDDSDDDELAPVVDLLAFRKERQAQPRARSPLELEVRDGMLWLHHRSTMGNRQIGLDQAHVNYLKEHIRRFEQAEHDKLYGPRQHRCFSCGRVKWIECQAGHRAWGETRTHYAVEVLEYRTIATAHYSTVSPFADLLGVSTPVQPQDRKVIAKARTACSRITRDVSLKWDDVDCALCLRRKPRVVA